MNNKDKFVYFTVFIGEDVNEYGVSESLGITSDGRYVYVEYIWGSDLTSVKIITKEQFISFVKAVFSKDTKSVENLREEFIELPAVAYSGSRYEAEPLSYPRYDNPIYKKYFELIGSEFVSTAEIVGEKLILGFISGNKAEFFLKELQNIV